MKITDVIHKDSAALHSDGLKLFHEIVRVYKPGHTIEISFEGLSHCTSAFLNASIGKFILLSENKEQVTKNFTYLHATEDTLKKIAHVVEISTNEKKRDRQNELVSEEFFA